MTTKMQLLIAVAISQVLFLGFVAVSSAPTEGENETVDNLLGDVNYPMTLQYLGMVDGKAYFAEVNQTMNWTAAADYCQASRLTLASIETQEQADMLNKVLPDLGFGPRHYWTSGRETRMDSMFMWNETKIQVNSSLVRYWFMRSSEYHCVYFYAHPTNSDFTAIACTIEYRPLCQS